MKSIQLVIPKMKELTYSTMLFVSSQCNRSRKPNPPASKARKKNAPVLNGIPKEFTNKRSNQSAIEGSFGIITA